MLLTLTTSRLSITRPLVCLLLSVWVIFGCQSLLANDLSGVQASAATHEMASLDAASDKDIQSHACCSSGTMLPLPQTSVTPDNNLPVWELSMLWTAIYSSAESAILYQPYRRLASYSPHQQLNPPPVFLQHCSFLI